LRYNNRKLLLGENFNIKEILYSSIPLKNITIKSDETIKIDLETGTVEPTTIGSYLITFGDGATHLHLTLNIEDPTPTFELSSTDIKKIHGNTIELRDLVNKSSLIGINASDISIQSDTAKIRNGIFTEHNYPGEYLIYYSYKIDDDSEIRRVLKVEILPLHISDANKFQRIFPEFNKIADYIRIPELIDELSKCYILYPNVSAVALRSLFEVSIRAFLAGVCKKEIKEQFPVAHGISWTIKEAHDRNPSICPTVLAEYRERLIKNNKKLVKYYEELDLNTYVHDCDSLPTSDLIIQSAKRFAFFLNFIIESIVARQNNRLG